VSATKALKAARNAGPAQGLSEPDLREMRDGSSASQEERNVRQIDLTHPPRMTNWRLAAGDNRS